jgi:hypothetical protein
MPDAGRNGLFCTGGGCENGGRTFLRTVNECIAIFITPLGGPFGLLAISSMMHIVWY